MEPSSEHPPVAAAPRRNGISGALVGVLAFALFFLPGRGDLSGTGPIHEVRPSLASEPAPPPGTGRVVVRVRVGSPSSPAMTGRIELRIEDGKARADLDGRGMAVLESLPLGAGTLTVVVPGHVRDVRTIEVGKSGEQLEIHLAPAALFRGSIVAPSGEGIAGATLRASTEGGLTAETSAGDDGSFLLDTLPAGPLELAVDADGYEGVTKKVEAPGEVRILLLPTADLRGAVVGRDGAPAVDAKVTVAGSGLWPPRELRTDTRGEFRIDDLPPGMYEVRAERGEDIAPPREGLSLESGAEVFVKLRLEPGASLVGRVVEAQSQRPLANAEITVTEEALALLPRTAKSDSEGQFRIGGLRRRSHHVSIVAPGYVPWVGERSIGENEDENFPLRRGATLAGTVVDERDRPVPFATLEVVGIDESGAKFSAGGFDLGLRNRMIEGASAAGHLGVTSGTPPKVGALRPAGPVGPLASAPSMRANATDANGRFSIEGVVPGRVQLVARAPGYAPGKTPMRFVAGGGRVTDLRIRMAAAGTIEGRLVDGRGYPLPGIPVELHDERDAMPRIALAGADGRFRFEGAFGAVVLTALLDGRPTARTRVDVGSGETVEVELAVDDARITLRGRAVDTDGYPLEGVHISIRSLRAESPVERAARSAGDGRFQVGGLPSPPFRILAEKTGFAPTRLDSVHDAEDEVRLILRPGATVSGTVVDDWSGEPVAGATLRLRGHTRGEPSSRAVTNTEGEFSFSTIPSGSYTIIASHEDHMEARVPAILRATRRGLEDLRLEPIRLPAGGSVSGQVVDRYGEPVPGAEVAVVAVGAHTTAIRTDVQGRFVLKGVPPGRVALVAHHPAAGEMQTPPLTVRIKEDTDAGMIRLPERFDPERVPEEEGLETGVAVRLGTGRGGPRVVRVGASSSAERAGLRVGDLVRAVDGLAVRSVVEAETALRGPIGVEAIVEIARGAEVRQIPVARERYLPP